MGMSDVFANIPIGEYVAEEVDLSPMQSMILVRIAALAPLLGNNNPKGVAELTKELALLLWKVEGEGQSVKFILTEKKNIPFIEDIVDGTTAIAGGDGGIAHNPDGSTYRSEVDPKFWGNKLDSLSLDAINVKEDIQNLGKIYASDAIGSALRSKSVSSKVISDAAPGITNEIGGMFK